MSQYPNGQYPYRTSAPLPHAPPPQDNSYQSQNPYPGHDPYQAVNGTMYNNAGYGNGRHGSTASRADEELFMGNAAPPPPAQQQYNGAYQPNYAAPSSTSSYNPQDYASHSSPNPSYSSDQSSVAQVPGAVSSYTSYNPADYANTSWSQQPGMPTYAYTSTYPGGSPQLIQMPSPPIVQPSGRMNSYSRPSVQTSYSSHYGGVAPPPLPVIPSAGDSPGDDWGTVPDVTRYDSNTGRYNTTQSYSQSQSISSPPMADHSRQSSMGQSASPGRPPPPPPHQQGTLGRNDSVDSRPLPRLPPSQQLSQYQYGASNATRYDQSQQQDLENQIMSLANPNGTYDADVDSDPEAVAGALAFQEAERQAAEDDARRASGQSAMFSGVDRLPSIRSPPPADVQSAIEEPGVDLSMLGGGWDAHMSYGGDPNQLQIERHGSIPARHGSLAHTMSSSGSRRKSGNTSDHDGAYGGLVDPSIRRLSFDEGDEAPLQPGEYPEMFYHPGITNRPLPQLPKDQFQHSHSSSAVPYAMEARADPMLYPVNQHLHLNSPSPGRHSSLVAHSATPSAVTPIRAKTVGEERRQAQRTSFIENVGEAVAPGGGVSLDLPGVAKRYNPAKLSARDFDRCREPWAMSELAGWLQKLVEEEQYLKRQPLVDGLVALFTYKIPTMHTADAETLAEVVIDDMRLSGTLADNEEWIEFRDTPISGVLYQLTGSGCYSPRVHEDTKNKSTRCYSHLCQRTEKKIDLSDQAARIEPDVPWSVYYNLADEDVKKLDSKEVSRQNIMHELVQKEENFVHDLHVLIEVYGAGLSRQQPPIIPPKRLDSFMRHVFGKAQAVLRAQEDHLLPQMKYRQKEQGPYIAGYSDILREWIRKAKPAYIDYASAYSQAVYLVDQEKEKNMLFNRFTEAARKDPRSKKLGLDNYLKVPITRIQQLVLLLDNVLQKSIQDNEEKRNLQAAIAEIRAVALECDARVGDSEKKVELAKLQAKLKLRPEMQQQVNLHLDHLGRELIFQGDVLRMGSGGIGAINKFNWLETHAILFDHYLVLAKLAAAKTPDGLIQGIYYDVSRYPIPMDLLILESDDDDPVVRSTLTGVSKVDRLQKTNTREQPGVLQHSGTSISLSTLGSSKSSPQVVTTLDNSKEDKILYPFKVRHLGKETYTLYAPSAANREDWCNKITEAKTKHAHSLFAQNAEPFKLRVVADTAFSYDFTPTGHRSVIIKGTPLDRAIRDVEAKYVNHGRPGPVCRAKVNCATSFRDPNGKAMVAVGTDYGVYIAEEDNPRGWTKVISNIKATQLSVIEEFSVFLVLADKALIAYHLDIICPANGVGHPNDSSRRAPQKLSGNRDVGFFATGRMKERILVFYKKKDVSSSTFKVMTVLEPVLQRSSEKKSRFPPLRSGKTEFFREYDDFYIGAECTGMNVFHSSISVSTIKGFEILNLDRKQPMSIPVDIEAEHTAPIAQRIAGQRPLGMFRLSDQEFLLCFETCAVYINKHGDINRSAILDFVGRARSAALFGPFVLLFDTDFVEVRNAMNGRLRQVIAGKDVKCLDDGQSGAGISSKLSVKMSMQHPEIDKNQIIVELVLNEGLRE